MWSYHPELMARPVPRYTSYPTALEFSDAVGRNEQQAALEAIEAGTRVSLYVHVPFCREICWYCGCNTGAANRSKRLASYLDALEREIETVRHTLRGRASVSRIAFGGGSPNALPPVGFVRLLDSLVTAFDAASAHVSIELDPRALTDSWFDVVEDAGITVASLGVQTLSPLVQRLIGRMQPLSMIESATTRLRKAGVTSLNFDLMYGLPNQSLDDIVRTLEETLRLRPDRIALFGYAHLPSVIKRQQRIDSQALPSQLERFDQARLGHDALVAAGYRAVGFDHFALPTDPLAIAAEQGRLRRNFQGFTDDASDVMVGLGASAISRFPQAIIQNEKNAGRYRMLVTAGELAGNRGVVRPEATQRRAEIIEALLCSGTARVPGDLMQTVRPHLEGLAARNLVTVDGDTLRIAADGLPYARVVASVFDSYRAAPATRLSNAV